MQKDATIALFQYWNRLRDGRPAPSRAEIEPSDIKQLLADTFILEADTRGAAVFRLAGTRLCAIYGRELKGYSFPLLWDAKDHRTMARMMVSLFRDRSVVVMEYEGVSKGDRKAYFEMLLLPLDAGRESPRCLGLVAPVERTFWLGADPIVDAQVTSVRVVDPNREPMFLKNRPAIAVNGNAMPSDMPSIAANDAGNGRRVRHLIVLDGGK